MLRHRFRKYPEIRLPRSGNKALFLPRMLWGSLCVKFTRRLALELSASIAHQTRALTSQLPALLSKRTPQRRQRGFVGYRTQPGSIRRQRRERLATDGKPSSQERGQRSFGSVACAAHPLRASAHRRRPSAPLAAAGGLPARRACRCRCVSMCVDIHLASSKGCF